VPPPPVTAISAKWFAPVRTGVNVKISEALVGGFHPCLTNFTIRFANENRQIDQVQTTGTNLIVAPGVPDPFVGANLITYDGACSSLKTPMGEPLQAFSLPIIP